MTTFINNDIPHDLSPRVTAAIARFPAERQCYMRSCLLASMLPGSSVISGLAAWRFADGTACAYPEPPWHGWLVYNDMILDCSSPRGVIYIAPHETISWQDFANGAVGAAYEPLS